MIFGLEQEDGSVITPMALVHPLHPIRSRSRLDDVFAPKDLGSGPYTQFIIVYIASIIAPL